jgi:hypothetical protein
LVDLAKRLRAGAVDRAHPQRVVFHHVPKCGGTSIGRALRKRYLLSQATINPEASFRAAKAMLNGAATPERLQADVIELRQKILIYLLNEDIRCVSAHVWFSEAAYRQFQGTYKFITVLREPMARFLSNFDWSYQKEGDHGRIDQPLEGFLDSDRAARFGAMYVQYFAGLPWDADLRAPAAIQAAIRNLEKFDVIGKLQDLPRFERDVQAALGVRLRIGHENRSGTGAGSRLAGLDPATRRKIEALCEPDLAVWRHFEGGGAASRH